MDYDEMETTDNYSDTEEILDSRDRARLINNMADSYIARKQEISRGKLLAHYKSAGLFKTYIDIYENAIVGKMKNRKRKTKDVVFGYASLEDVEAEGGTIYFKMKYEEIYYIQHLKMAERIVCQIIRQNIKAGKEWYDE